ncbi:MAG: asparagine synthetase A [Nitrososphaeria archaeon]
MRTQTSLRDVSLNLGLPKPLEMMSDEEILRKVVIGKVFTRTLKSLTTSFLDEDFDWLLPVIFSKSTDPLWPDPGSSIEKRIETEIYGETVRTTLSMIVHKMVACSLAYPKLFTLSPNVRVEKRERKSTGWHAYEFSQLDFEVRGASSSAIRSLVERVVIKLVEDLRKGCEAELTQLGQYDVLKIPKSPFKVFDREELEKEYGGSWETLLPKVIKEPVWVVNIPREFYDFEEVTGRWDNYDLIVPKYGEVLSGAKREWEYNKILKKIERDGIRKENFSLLLKLSKEGRLKQTAGAGIGVERIVTWIVGANHIGEVQPFPKIPGIVNEL